MPAVGVERGRTLTPANTNELPAPHGVDRGRHDVDRDAEPRRVELRGLEEVDGGFPEDGDGGYVISAPSRTAEKYSAL